MSILLINKKKISLFFMFFSLILFPVFILSVADSKDSKNINSKFIQDYISKITWQKPYKDNNDTIIIGSVKAGFGKFEFRWIIRHDETVKIITLESSGSGELPPMEKKILLLVLDTGNTILFQEWLPLVNVKEPYAIRPIAKVSTSDLFSLLPKVKTPPTSTINQKIYKVKWSKTFLKNEIKYLQGAVKASFGTLNIYWKKGKEHPLELITLESPGAGELPLMEMKLFPWMDESKGITIIFQERMPQLNQGNISYLWPLTAVKTSDFISGFKRLNK